MESPYQTYKQGTPIIRQYFSDSREAYWYAALAMSDGQCVQVYCSVPDQGTYLVETCQFRPVAQEFPSVAG